MKKIKKLKKIRISTINRLPKFIIYTLVQQGVSNNKKIKNKSSVEKYYFQCNICKKLFKTFLHLQRHSFEVEYDFKIQCKHCGIKIKRIKEHEKTCKKLKDKKVKNICKSKKKTSHKENKITQFKSENTNVLINNEIIENLKKNYKYFEVLNKYIYFQDYIIGEGSYGLVVFGIKIDDNSPVAIKLQINANSKDELQYEKEILSTFPPNYPFPKFYYHLLDDSGNLLVESLTGPSLDKLYKFCNNAFDENTICNIGIDLLNCLEILHKEGIIHNDLKEDNIVILLKNAKIDNSEITCTLIDFGFSIQFKDKKYKNKKRDKNKHKCGNTKYASFNSLQGGEIGPKDDLESLCYILLRFFNNTLPWLNLDKTNKKKYKEKVLKQKRNFNINAHCPKNLLPFSDIFNDIKNLQKNDVPNYKKYKNLLKKMIKDNKLGEGNHYRFKWEKRFHEIMEEFSLNKNFQILNEAIKIAFKGYPEQIGFSYINQFYNE